MTKEAPHEDKEFIFPIFVTPKKDGIYKLIVNLKDLNQYIEYIHFKMHGLQEILKLVKSLCKMASLDFKDNSCCRKFSKVFKISLER